MDLLVKNGELQLSEEEVLTTSDIAHIVRNVVLTPQGAIQRYANELQDVYLIDEDFGNPVYRQLSEPLTLQWILQAKQGIMAALRLANIFPRSIEVEGSFSDVKIVIYINADRIELNL